VGMGLRGRIGWNRLSGKIFLLFGFRGHIFLVVECTVSREDNG
jgi:hypothetical protein